MCCSARGSGGDMRAVGSNTLGATRVGIRANRQILLAFVLSGLLTGVAGLILAGQVGIGSPATGIDYTLMSITSVVLGGTRIAGGRGSVLSVLMGAALVQSLSSASSFINKDSAIHLIVLGAVTMVAATFFSVARRGESDRAGVHGQWRSVRGPGFGPRFRFSPAGTGIVDCPPIGGGRVQIVTPPRRAAICRDVYLLANCRTRNGTAMKLGFFTMPIHPLGRDWRTTLREDREAFLLADELGFCEAYVGEHVTDLAENITSCTIFLASLADRIKTMRLGTGTVNLPNSHPANVAAQIAMLDHMLDGRLNFGISPGGLLSDAEIFGNLEADRNAMFVEGIETILKLWATDPPYDIDGKYWKLTTAKNSPQGDRAGHHRQTAAEAASSHRRDGSRSLLEGRGRRRRPRLGSDLGQFLDAEMGGDAQGQLHRRLQCRRATGRFGQLAGGEEHLRRGKLAAAHAYARGPKSPYVHYYHSLFTKLVRNGRSNLFKEDPDLPDAELTLDHVLDRCVICGSPSEVVEQLIAFREEVGPFGTMLYAGHDWADPGLAKASMRLMAEKVGAAHCVSAAIRWDVR